MSTLPTRRQMLGELAAMGAALTVPAYVEHVSIGNQLPSMPLFLASGACVNVPLSATYNAAFDAVPRRWRTVLGP